MNTKTVLQLDDAGYLVGLTVADESPLEPGVFLMPRGAVDAAAPTVPDGYRARWSGAGFDFDPLPPLEPEAEPPPPSPEEIRRGEIAGRLAQIDMDSIRALRAKAIGKAVKFDDDKLTALEAEAAALRAELATLGA